jgi:8-oxo-dGTP pyrophosphatase MutT (NUDIX family)
VNESLLQSTHVPGIDRLVAGAVVHSDAGVLIVRRSLSDDFLPGIEELPSGGCGPGETLGEALDRELQEEIGWRGDKTRRVVEQWWQQRPGGADS